MTALHFRSSKMLNNNYDDAVAEEEGVLNQLKQISPNHMIVAYRAKMTHYEILLCQKISAISKLSLFDVLLKMEAFKQTSEHLLYKKEFSFA
jgi:hypothetical protein